MTVYLKLLAALFILSFSCVLHAKQPLHIVLGDNYGKHAMAIDGVPRGIQKDLLSWFLIEHMGLDVKLEAMPWKRAQQMVVEAKKADGYFTAYTEKRVKVLKLVPSKLPFYSTQVKMHTWKGNPNIARLKQLKDVDELLKQKDIWHVIISGHGYHEALYKNASTVHRLIDSKQIPKFLLSYKRADVFVEQSELFYPLVEDDGLKEQVVTLDNINFKSLDWHLYIRPGSVHLGLMEEVNRSLEDAIAQGILQDKMKQIFHDYGLEYSF